MDVLNDDGAIVAIVSAHRSAQKDLRALLRGFPLPMHRKILKKGQASKSWGIRVKEVKFNLIDKAIVIKHE
jgi:hypothetical protein